MQPTLSNANKIRHPTTKVGFIEDPCIFDARGIGKGFRNIYLVPFYKLVPGWVPVAVASDRLDSPLAAQDIDGGLNGTAVVNFHRWRLRAYKFVRTSPRYRAVIPCPESIRSARVGLNFTGRREPHKIGATK